MPFSIFYSFSIMFKTHVLQMESFHLAHIFSFTSIQKTPIWLKKKIQINVLPQKNTSDS